MLQNGFWSEVPISAWPFVLELFCLFWQSRSPGTTERFTGPVWRQQDTCSHALATSGCRTFAITGHFDPEALCTELLWEQRNRSSSALVSIKQPGSSAVRFGADVQFYMIFRAGMISHRNLKEKLRFTD